MQRFNRNLIWNRLAVAGQSICLTRNNTSMMIKSSFGTFLQLNYHTTTTFQQELPNSSKKMIIPYILPEIGADIKKVKIFKWHIKEGDSIKEFDLIVEIETDKCIVDLTSKYNGEIKRLRCRVGEHVNVGMSLFDIEIDKEEEKK